MLKYFQLNMYVETN